VWKLQEKATAESEQWSYDHSVKKVSKVTFGMRSQMPRVTLDTTEILLNKTIQKVSDDIEAMHFNTAISAMMILVGEFEKAPEISKSDFEVFLKILSPFAPHICEEIWSNLGNKSLIATEKWPQADASKMQTETVTVVIQVNGKVRVQTTVTRDMSENELVESAKKMPDVDKWLVGKNIVKIIHISNRLLNFVIS